MPHTVTLKGGKDRILLDFHGGNFRLAFYYQPKGSKAEIRASTAKPNLYDALEECLRVDGSPYKHEVYDLAHELETYIYSTPWGEMLPR